MTTTPGGGKTYLVADSTIQTRKGRAAAPRRLAPCPPLRKSDHDAEQDAQLLTPYHAKVSYSLKHNIDAFFARHPLERCAFLTLTFPENVSSREAARRFRNLKEGVLRDHFDGWIGVIERTARNRIHFHLLVAARFDVRTGFDFDAYLGAQTLASQRNYGPEHRRLTKAYSGTAPVALRDLWALFREKCPNYGFGRHECVPIRANGEAVAFYVGKYVSKHVGQRRPDDIRAKTIFLSQECRRNTTRLAWHSPGATLWRKALASVAHRLHVETYEMLPAFFGPRWAYKLTQAIALEASHLDA